MAGKRDEHGLGDGTHEEAHEQSAELAVEEWVEVGGPAVEKVG